MISIVRSRIYQVRSQYVPVQLGRTRKGSFPRVLVLETGGTIAQERGKDGLLRPSDRGVLERMSQSDRTQLTRQRDVSFIKFDPLIDSTNMALEQRVGIARVIYAFRHEFDGFVVLHGTDTMTYTAAALTYMLQGLGKPIIMSGS